MRIVNLNINRFGLRSHLRLNGLSPQLNVVYGPVGSGKTAAIQFLQWILYGYPDDISSGLDSSDALQSSGSADVQYAQRSYTIRHVDGRLTVHSQSVGAGSTPDLRELLSKVGPRQFNENFVVSFDDGSTIRQLLETASASGLDLATRSRNGGRRRRLEFRLTELRKSLSSMPLIESIASLSQRKHRLQDNLERLTHSPSQGQTDPSLERGKLYVQADRVGQRRDQLRGELHDLEWRIDQQDHRYGSWRDDVVQYGPKPPGAPDDHVSSQDLQRQRDRTRHQIAECDGQLRELNHRVQRLEQLSSQVDPDEQERVRAELREVNASLVEAERREELNVEVAAVEHELQVLTDEVRSPRILQEASSMVRRTSDGHHDRILVDINGDVWLDTRSSTHAVRYDRLSQATRDEVRLCLSLAIQLAYRRHGIELPIILSDAFVHVESGRDALMADLIVDFARHGFQVLLFTRQPHVAELFRQRGIRSFELRPYAAQRQWQAPLPEYPRPWHNENQLGAVPQPMFIEDETVDPVTKPRAWSQSEPDFAPPAKADPETAFSGETQAIASTSHPPGRTRDETIKGPSREDLRFHLHKSDAVVSAPSIGPRTATHLENIGICTVEDLLRADPASAATEMDNPRIKPQTIRDWQAQSELACRIPELQGHDAQILVSCGVTDPETLAHMDSKELWNRVSMFVDTTKGKRILRNGKTPNFDEIKRWITWSRESRPLRAA